MLPVLPILLSVHAPPAPPAGAEQARAVFAEAAQLSRQDDGRLWKVYLAGPILLVDPSSRRAWANEEILGWERPAKGVWTGTLEEAPAQAAQAFLGRYWAILTLPLPEETGDRRRLIVRSLFRRLEPTLGLPRNRPEPAHLLQPGARRWLSLEAAALRRALTSQGPAFQEALEDAIVFRVWRRARFKPDSNAERILELNEGLGEFTARVLVTPERPELLREVLLLLDRVSPSNFARAFGLAYGLLMEGRKNSRWRGLIDGEVDLGLVLREVWNVATPLVSAAEVERRAQRYTLPTAAAP